MFDAINFKIFWQPNELFLVRPPFAWELMWGYVGFLGALALIVIVASFLKKVPRDIKMQLISFALGQFILGLVLFFFRYERIPYLGMDILRLIQYIIVAVWVYGFVKKLRTELPKQSLEQKIAERRNKYLPKAK